MATCCGKTGRAMLGPVGWSWSELAVMGFAVVARLRMLATSAIITRFGVFVEAAAIIARLRMLVEAAAIIARLRMLVEAAAIIAHLRVFVEAAAIVTQLRMPVEAAAIVAHLSPASGRDGHSAVAALATATTGP